MSTNISHLKINDTVSIDANQLKSNEPRSWLNIGKIIGFTLDEELTDMNQRNLKIYRVLVQFERLPQEATPDEIELFGEHHCYNASLLPIIVRKIH